MNSFAERFTIPSKGNVHTSVVAPYQQFGYLPRHIMKGLVDVLLSLSLTLPFSSDQKGPVGQTDRTGRPDRYWTSQPDRYRTGRPDRYRTVRPDR
jgi:hypothetical protein